MVDAATGKVVKEYPRQKNLILNQGMEKVYDLAWANLMLWCSAGTGTTPTSVDSGAVTVVSWAGTTLTLSGGALLTNTATDAGKIIKFDSGEEARIATVDADPLIAYTTTSAPGSPTGLFTIYNTNQTTLGTLLKSTQTYLTGAPYCQTVLTANVYALRRTYDFTAEVGTVNYTEISVGWVSALITPTALFSRILLAAPVAVTAGQQLRVTYELDLTLLPAASTVRAAIPIAGWPVSPAPNTNGTEAIQLIGLQAVSSADGTSVDFDIGAAVNEPSTTGALFLSTVSTAPQTMAAIHAAGFPVTRAGTSPAGVGVTRAAYIPNSFYADKTGTFAVGVANRSDWRSMGLGSTAGGTFAYDRYTILFVFDSSQTKLNTHTLTLTWRFSWSRVLS